MVTLADVDRAIAARDPQLGEILVRYLAQDDPEPGRDELHPQSEDMEDVVDVVAGAFTIDRLRGAVGDRGLANKNPTEKKLARRDAFAAAEGSQFSPPRLKLWPKLVELYAQGDPAARAALLHVFAHAEMKWGVWKAAKAIYKRAEELHDAALFGVLAYRFDAMTQTSYASKEIGYGTLVYLRRRAWRYLRLLGQASPDAYPAYAVEVLRHYPASYSAYSPSWVAAHIMSHKLLRYARSSSSFLGDVNGGVLSRAFPDAWRLSPAPLLRLLDSAENDLVCAWAIGCLRADHALALRAVEPAWLARLGKRPLAAIHTFVVSLLRESPELHQSKLRQLGLHDVVLSFLRSPSQEARTYALEYAAAQQAEIGIEELVSLIEEGAAEVKKFAAARLEQLDPKKLGMRVILRLLGNDAAPWAAAKLAQGFSPKDLDAALFVETSARGANAYNALVKFFNDARVTIPAGHFTTLLDDPRFADNWQLRTIVQGAFTELGKRGAREIGIPWIQASLENRNRTDTVVRWLDAGMLAGDDLNVDWLKGLVGKPRLRPIALRLLGDRRRVSPARVGLTWLLEVARSQDADLAQFAQRMLLESFQPEDFANGDRAAGVARLWELATGKKQPEAVRTFAATYLKAHHPDLGPRMPESRSLGITPRLAHGDYSLTTVRPLFEDDRVDVRRLGVAIASEEIVRWANPDLVYELAASAKPEARALGGELLLGVLGEQAKLPAAWIDGARLFALAESNHKASREVALTLIRHMYERVGGAEKLAWLMDSPERDVRLFAVRLFWDRHRPVPWPADYVPRKAVGAPAKGRQATINTERFADLTALRQFARVVLFGLPPGRVGKRDVVEGGAVPERALPASVAKRRLIEAMRDVALEDVEFARAIAPVFGEFVDSTAKGEWQASLQALTQLRAVHEGLA